jgi:hypothetical protein
VRRRPQRELLQFQQLGDVTPAPDRSRAGCHKGDPASTVASRPNRRTVVAREHIRGSRDV